jgi:hypothetical protein
MSRLSRASAGSIKQFSIALFVGRRFKIEMRYGDAQPNPESLVPAERQRSPE